MSAVDLSNILRHDPFKNTPKSGCIDCKRETKGQRFLIVHFRLILIYLYLCSGVIIYEEEKCNQIKHQSFHRYVPSENFFAKSMKTKSEGRVNNF